MSRQGGFGLVSFVGGRDSGRPGTTIICRAVRFEVFTEDLHLLVGSDSPAGNERAGNVSRRHY